MTRAFAQTFEVMSWFPLITLPMFIFMGYVLSESRLADDPHRMFPVWFGPVPGGLAIGTVVLMVLISAIHGLMKTVAIEGGSFDVRANAIAPGCVEGPCIDAVIVREAAMRGITAQVIRAAQEAGTSMRSFVSARDIAELAVFLASPAARRVSGQIIAVDGPTENPDPKAP